MVDSLKGVVYAYRKPSDSVEIISEQILQMSEIARREGLLSLEGQMEFLDNEFFKKGISFIVDGSDPELLRDIMENELNHKVETHRRRIRFWQDLGAYAPAWGMVGILLGLINMLKAMGMDAAGIGTGMSLALITTLYGSVLSNWLCIPVAAKLSKNSENEQLIMEIIIEGVLSVQAGENTRIVKEKIKSRFLRRPAHPQAAFCLLFCKFFRIFLKAFTFINICVKIIILQNGEFSKSF